MKKDINHNILYRRVSEFTYPFFIILLLFFNVKSFAQWEPNETAKEAYQLVLSLKLDQAEDLTHLIEYPSHLYIHHLSKAIRATIDESDEVFEEFKQYHSYSYDLLEDFDDQSPYKKFYRAEMQLQSAIVHLKHNEEWNSIMSLRRAYIIIKSNTEEYPDFLPNYKTYGLIHIIIGSVPANYQWALSILGFDGETKQGLLELDLLANSDNLYNQEAIILLSLVNSYILQNSVGAVAAFTPLYQANKDNLLFGYFYASLLMKNAKSEAALDIINHLLSIKNKEHTPFPILEYLKAEIMLQRGNLSSSISWYTHFINTQKGSNFIKDSYYKIALNYLLLEEKEKSIEFIELAKNNGVTNTEADKYAHSRLTDISISNPVILRLRFAIDGGYYDRANTIIEQVDDFTFATKIDEVEYNYRKARFYHKTNKTTMAIALYKVTINASVNKEWYFGANAALQLGYIYKDQMEIDMAKKYFEIAMSYKDHEYKNSIDNKAKSALASLN